MKALLFLALASLCSAQTWSGCTSPASRQSFIYVTPAGAPNARTMFVTLNNNSTNTPPGGIWSTSNLCPTSTGQWASVTGNRAGNISARSSTQELYFDNANAGTVPNTSHVRYLAGNTVLTDTASPVNGWACASDSTRDVIVCMERNGDIFSSADNFTSAISTNRCSGSPITGMSVTADGIWWALCESINSSRSTNAGSSWSNIGSVGGAGTQIVKLQNGQYIDCDGEGNAYPRIWDGATTWNQLSGSSFPGANGTVACSRMTTIGSDIWMVANDTTFNPIVYKTSTGTGAWTAETGTGLPSSCSSKCQPRDIFYDVTSGYAYITILGSGGQATSIYRSLIGAPTPSCSADANGVAVTGLNAIQGNLLGPVICYGASPWIFGDLAENGTAQNMAVNALIETPTLGTACPGTASWTSGSNIVTTTASMVACLSGKTYVVLAWDSVDGAGTGRAQCPISTVTATTITCQENLFEPTSSGVTAYNMPGPGPSGFDFLGWTAESPSVSWNYYDVAIGLYRLYYRTLNATYQTQARAYADITWQWTLDHGYRFVTPRAASMISQFFRAGEGHSERLPGLYNWISHLATAWVPTFCPYCDNREAGYMTWDEALGAKVDTDPMRHAQYCSWLTTYVPQWNSVQSADGSFGENEYALNPTFVSAPKAFSAPFLYQGAPWRVAINVKALEAAYESLNDVSSQGCSSPSLAATTLTTITNAVTWQRNYGRDSVNRGVYYEVNSQSDDQDSVFPGGTVSINLTSTSLLGSGTSWSTGGYCDGTHFIGIAGPNDPRTVYKIASCVDNTHATLSVAFGLYGETLNASAQQYGIAPAAFTGCHSSATYCFGSAGDRNLTRTVCGDTGWLYNKTLNATYKSWTDECLSAQLGGPTAGLTSAANEGAVTLPCSGPACDGLVTDTWEAAANCGATVPINTAPCLYGNTPLSNLGKNFGEAFGAPGVDNALAWRLSSPGPGPCSISPTTLGPWTNTQVISQTMTTTCSGGTITWTSSSLPSGLSGCNAVTGATCVLSGTLNAANSYTPTITATATNTASISPAVVVNVVPSIATTSLPGGIPGTPYSQAISVSGGTSPLVCSISSGTLSGSGLTLNASSCTITGTPNTTVATYVFTVRVTDANSISNGGLAPRLSIAIGSPCDLNGDGIVNVQDTQLSVNMSLSIIPCTANINGAGVCNSVTISRVVTASLGGACVVGP